MEWLYNGLWLNCKRKNIYYVRFPDKLFLKRSGYKNSREYFSMNLKQLRIDGVLIKNTNGWDIHGIVSWSFKWQW